MRIATILSTLIVVQTLGVVGGWLASLAEIESIVFLGPVFSCSGMLISGLAITRQKWTCVAFGLGVLLLSVACFLLINGLSWSPDEAYLPINSIIAAYTVIHAPWCWLAILDARGVKVQQNAGRGFQFTISGIMLLTGVVACTLALYRALGLPGTAVPMLIWYGLVASWLMQHVNARTQPIKHPQLTSEVFGDW